jgi:hypothetical protein
MCNATLGKRLWTCATMAWLASLPGGAAVSAAEPSGKDSAVMILRAAVAELDVKTISCDVTDRSGRLEVAVAFMWIASQNKNSEAEPFQEDFRVECHTKDTAVRLEPVDTGEGPIPVVVRRWDTRHGRLFFRLPSGKNGPSAKDIVRVVAHYQSKTCYLERLFTGGATGQWIPVGKPDDKDLPADVRRAAEAANRESKRRYEVEPFSPSDFRRVDDVTQIVLVAIVGRGYGDMRAEVRFHGDGRTEVVLTVLANQIREPALEPAFLRR